MFVTPLLIVALFLLTLIYIGEDEFYPEHFMEPLRNYLEFQEAIVHTQLFVAFMDKLKKEQQLLQHIR